MSFSSDAKAELCQQRPDKRSLALAECYGILLYCHSFSAREIRLITGSADFARRLPKLFKRAFSLSFDSLPEPSPGGKQRFLIQDRDKLRTIFDAFGAERQRQRQGEQQEERSEGVTEVSHGAVFKALPGKDNKKRLTVEG